MAYIETRLGSTIYAGVIDIDEPILQNVMDPIPVNEIPPEALRQTAVTTNEYEEDQPTDIGTIVDQNTGDTQEPKLNWWVDSQGNNSYTITVPFEGPYIVTYRLYAQSTGVWSNFNQYEWHSSTLSGSFGKNSYYGRMEHEVSQKNGTQIYKFTAYNPEYYS